jgi:hypothetical protein
MNTEFIELLGLRIGWVPTALIIAVFYIFAIWYYNRDLKNKDTTTT